MRTVSLEELLEAGCHFGHQVSRQNAKAREYIFEPRDGIHIIDLEKTKEGLEDAAKFVKEIGCIFKTFFGFFKIDDMNTITRFKNIFTRFSVLSGDLVAEMATCF